MSSNASKARTKRKEKPTTQKKRLIFSNNKCESVQNNSNAVIPYKGYNLRSNSPSKVPVQLTSKTGKISNTDSEFLMKRKYKRKDNITGEINSREAHSSSNDSYSPSSKSCKAGKNIFTKSQIPKYNYFPVTDIGNNYEKSDEKSVDIGNTMAPFKPYKSILKRLTVNTSPMKNPHYANLNEKDIIKERIYGPSQLKQKKVKFKTMSCNSLEVFNYEHINSKDLKEIVKTNENLNESASEEIHDGDRQCSEQNSENKNDDTSVAVMVLSSKELSLGENVPQNQTEEIEEKNESFMSTPQPSIFPENMKTPHEGYRNNYFQNDQNQSKSSPEKSSSSEELNQHITNITDADVKNQGGNVINEQQSSEQKLHNTKMYNTTKEIENFRILADVETIEALKISAIFQKIRTDTKSAIQSFENVDQANTFNSLEESTEEKSLDNKAVLCEDKTDNMANFLPRFTPRSIAQDQEIQKQIGYQGLLQKEINEKVKILTASYLKDIQKGRRRKKKKSPKICDVTDEQIMREEFNTAESKFDSGNEISTITAEEKNDILMSTPKLSNSKILNTPQNNFYFQQKQKVDLNQSAFRSPKISKIPRLTQNLDIAFSPYSEKSHTPIKNRVKMDDEVSVKQKGLNCSCNSENSLKQSGSLNGSVGTKDYSSLLKQNEDVINSFEDTSIINDSLLTSLSQNCDEEVSNDLLKLNENLLETQVNYNEFKLSVNSSASVSGINDDFKEEERSTLDDEDKEDAQIIRELNQEIYKASEDMEDESDENSNTEVKERHDKENRLINKIPTSKRGNTIRIRRSSFMKYFFVNILLYMVFFKILEHDFTCDI